MLLGIFKTTPPPSPDSPTFKRSVCFTWQSLVILNVFNTLVLKQVLWKTKTFLKIFRSSQVFLEISQNSQENTYARLLKKETLAQVFSCEFCEISKNTFFYRTRLVDWFWLLEYLFLVESRTIERGIFPYKTSLSKANFKTNRIRSTKWSYQKERGFATILLIWKFNWSVRATCK